MALLRVDWNPSENKIRQFGGLLALFALIVAFAAWRKGQGQAAQWTAIGGVALGAVSAAVPAFGALVYRAWMCVAFVIGSIVSTLLLAALYFGAVTPLGLWFRIRGRDALALRRGGKKSYWVPLEIPEETSYFERLS